MNKKIRICFSTILGNISIENETKANITTYSNFFASLYGSKLPVSLHLTGSFLQMLQKKDQAFYDIIKELLEKKQIAMLGGAYYSPLFPLLSTIDITGQVEMHVSAQRKIFYPRSKSVILPFSAWNPVIIPALKKSGVDYCLLNNELFSRHGLYPYLPVNLEDAGKVITAVPFIEKNTISESPKEFCDTILNKAKLNNKFNIIVIFIPHTEFTKILSKENNETKTWVEEFIECTSQYSNLKLTTVESCLKTQKIYPSAFIEPNIITESGAENASVKKLIFQNEFAYTMYKKIIYVSVMANQVRGDIRRRDLARKYLWKAQNAVFFIKAYFSPAENRSLFFEFYKTLILAEKTARDSKFVESLVPYDFNLDGFDEYVSQTKNLNTYVDTIGGKIVEYDFLTANKNFCLMPFENPTMFSDYFADKDEIKNLFEKEPKNSLSNTQYQVVKYTALKKTLNLKAEYNVQNIFASVKKNFAFNGDMVSVQYILKNKADETLSRFFVSSLDIAIGKVGNRIPSVVIYAQNKKIEQGIEKIEVSNLTWLQINDAESRSRISISTNENINISLIPVKDKNENIVGVKLYLYWELLLEPNCEAEKLITMQIERIKR
ncbi:MAG: DUF1926 domain-containing protein [Treponemataceae bacterium]